MERRAVFDGLAETPVRFLAAPLAHGFERDDLPVDGGSDRDTVFIEVLAVICISDFAYERTCESCLGGFALELADQAAVGFHGIFGRNIFSIPSQSLNPNPRLRLPTAMMPQTF
mgnify:CR=1 FL=1